MEFVAKIIISISVFLCVFAVSFGLVDQVSFSLSLFVILAILAVLSTLDYFAKRKLPSSIRDMSHFFRITGIPGIFRQTDLLNGGFVSEWR